MTLPAALVAGLFLKPSTDGGADTRAESRSLLRLAESLLPPATALLLQSAEGFNAPVRAFGDDVPAGASHFQAVVAELRARGDWALLPLGWREPPPHTRDAFALLVKAESEPVASEGASTETASSQHDADHHSALSLALRERAHVGLGRRRPLWDCALCAVAGTGSIHDSRSPVQARPQFVL